MRNFLNFTISIKTLLVSAIIFVCCYALSVKNGVPYSAPLYGIGGPDILGTWLPLIQSFLPSLLPGIIEIFTAYFPNWSEAVGSAFNDQSSNEQYSAVLEIHEYAVASEKREKKMIALLELNEDRVGELLEISKPPDSPRPAKSKKSEPEE